MQKGNNMQELRVPNMNCNSVFIFISCFYYSFLLIMFKKIKQFKVSQKVGKQKFEE